MFAGGNQNVNVTYTADVSQYQQTMGEAIASTEQYAKVADGAVGAVSKLGIAMTRFMSGGVNGNRSLMSPAIQEAAAYEQKLSQLEARSRAAGAAFGSMGESVRQMARTLPVGLSGALTQFETLSRMGVTVDKNIAGVAESVTRLGAATGEMGPGLTSSMVQFQRTFNAMDAGAFTKMGDSIAATTAKMGASAQGTMEFANQIAPLGKVVGMTATQVEGFSAAFDRLGQDGVRGASVFNRMISDMDRSVREGTPTLSVYAGAVGKTTEQFKELVKANPSEAMIQFFESMSKGGRDAIRTLDMLGMDGPRTLSTITAISQGGGIRQAVQTAQSAYGDGTQQAASDVAFSGLNDTLGRVNESMRQMVEASGRPMLGALTSMSQGAANVANLFAGIVSNPLFQGLATAAFAARTLGGTASMLGGAGITSMQAMSLVPNRAWNAGTSFLRNYRMPLLAGGAGALLAGSMMDNPTMAMLGGVGLLASSAPGTFSGLKRVAGWGINTAYSGPFDTTNARFFGRANPNTRNVERIVGEMTGLGVTSVTPGAFRGDAGAARKTFEQVAAINGKYVKAAEGLTDATAKARLESMRVAEVDRAARMGATQANAVRGGIGNAIKGGAALGGNLLAAGLTSPVMWGVAGVAAAGFGAYEWNQVRERSNAIADDPSANYAKIFAEKAGVALKPLQEFADTASALVATATTTRGALRLSASEQNRLVGATGDPTMVIPETFRNDPKKLAAFILATSGAQGPQSLSAAMMNAARQSGVPTAQQAGDLISASGAVNSPTKLVASWGDALLADTNTGDPNASNWQKTMAAFSPSYEGQDEVSNLTKALATQVSTSLAEVRRLRGDRAYGTAGLKALDKALETYQTKYSGGDKGGGDPSQLRQMLEGIGFSTADADKYASFAENGLDNEERQRIMNEAPVAVEWSKLKSKTTKTGSTIEALRGGSGQDRELAQVLAYANRNNIDPEQLLRGLRSDSGISEDRNGRPVVLPRRIMRNADTLQSQVQGVIAPSEITAYTAAMQVALRDPMRAGAMGNIQSRMVNRLADDPQSPEYMRALAQYQAAQAMLPMAAAQSTTVSGLMQSMDMSSVGYQAIRKGKAPRDETQSQMWQQQFGQYQQAQIGIIDYAKQKLGMEREYQIQSTRQREDFERQTGYAEEDYYRQRRWSQSDYHRQASRATADFYREQRYATQDFQRSMQYAAEDTAKSMADPWQRLQPTNLLAPGSVMHNMEDQNRYLREQVRIVDELKKRGLKQSTVDQLGLADPSNVLRTQNFANLSKAEISRLNQLSKARAQLGAGYTADDDNVQTRRAREGFSIQQERSEGNFRRSLHRSDVDFQRSMNRQAIQFDKTMSRNREQFSLSMSRAREDVDRATEEIVVSFDDALKMVTGKIKTSGDTWEKYTRQNMGGVTTATHKGWKSATNVHHSAINWVYQAYKALAIDGKSAAPWNSSAPTTTGGSGGSGGTSTTSGGGGGGGGADVSHAKHGSDVDSEDKRQFPLPGASGDSGPGTLSFPKWDGANGSNPAPDASSYNNEVTGVGKNNFIRLLTSVLKGTAGLPGFFAGGKMGSLASFLKKLDGGAGNAEHLMPQTLRAGQIVAGMFPQVKTIGGWRPTDDYSFHPGGVALDLMMPSGGHTKSDVQLGNRIAEYFMRTAAQNGVSYMIWRQRIWNAAYESPKPPWQWRGMGSRGDWTSNHMDHVHLNLKDGSLSGLGPVPGAKGAFASKKKALAKWDKSLWSLINTHPSTKSLGLSGGAGSRAGAGENMKGMSGRKRTRATGWVWPFDSPTFGSHKDFREDRGDHLHAGEDMTPAPGTSGMVHAIGPGRVTQVGYEGDGYGNFVVIRHPDSRSSLYGHLANTRVRQGQSVNAGTSIGMYGNTGHSFGNHLHLNVSQRGGNPFDVSQNVSPWSFLKQHAMAMGGVVTGPTRALIGEAGDKEAVIPLNKRGVEVIAEAMGRYAHSYEAKAARTAHHAMPVINNATYHYDQSNRFEGPITVKASDPGQMAKALEARARQQRLLNPARGR